MPEGQNDENKEQNHRICKKRDGADCGDGDGCFFYNCPNYITEVQFYPIIKEEQDLLEKEMARLK